MSTFIFLPPQGSRFWGDAVATVGALPSTGAVTGECRLVLSTDVIYEWNGSAWQIIANGASGDALAATVAGFTPGAIIFARAGTLDQDPTKLFWDGTNLGVGTNTPAYPLDIVGNNTYPAGDPTAANIAISYGASTGYPTGGYTYQYRVYAYKSVSGTTYYSLTPTTTSSDTDNGQTISGPTVSATGNINYGGSGYTATGSTWTLQVYIKLSTPQGDVWSATPGQAVVMDDNSLSPYSIDWNWSLPAIPPGTVATDTYLLRNGSDYIAVGGLITTLNDTNTGWSFGGGSAPSPTSVADTISLTVSWTADPSITPDGYRVLKYSTYSGYNFDYYYDTGSTSIVDNNTLSWSSGPSVTPNQRLGAALRVIGDLGFYNATPVGQYTPQGVYTSTGGGGTYVYLDSTFTGGIGSSAYTIGDVFKALKLVGILTQ